MKKGFFAVAVAAFLAAGCSSTAKIETVKAKDGKQYSLSGHHDVNTEELRIFVNGKTALTGKIGNWSGGNLEGGSYDGKPVTASCHYGIKILALTGRALRCSIFIDGELMEEEIQIYL